MAEDLRPQALKRLYATGSHGMLQRHLFQRLPPRSLAQLIGMMKGMEAAGLVQRERSTRHTTGWGYVWRITHQGRAAYHRHLGGAPLDPVAAEPGPDAAGDAGDARGAGDDTPAVAHDPRQLELL